MLRLLPLLLAALLLAPAVAHAEGTLAGQVAAHDTWVATGRNSVHVWPSGSQPCRSDVLDRTYGRTWKQVPFPAGFKPDPGDDHEAILRDQTGSGLTYEFWTLRQEGWTAGGCAIWSAGYVTTGPDGVQGSGLRFEYNGGLPRLAELASGTIAHEVQIEVPWACKTFKAPAIRHDTSVTYDRPDCIPYGQRWRLPAPTDCAGLWSPAARALCAAARSYGLINTDQTGGYAVQVRMEGAKPGQASPYYADGGYFGCGSTSGAYCWPTTNAGGSLRGFPWALLATVG